jgi:hypothetical protein
MFARLRGDVICAGEVTASLISRSLLLASAAAGLVVVGLIQNIAKGA